MKHIYLIFVISIFANGCISGQAPYGGVSLAPLTCFSQSQEAMVDGYQIIQTSVPKPPCGADVTFRYETKETKIAILEKREELYFSVGDQQYCMADSIPNGGNAIISIISESDYTAKASNWLVKIYEESGSVLYSQHGTRGDPLLSCVGGCVWIDAIVIPITGETLEQFKVSAYSKVLDKTWEFFVSTESAVQ